MSSLQPRPGHWLLRCPLCKSGFTVAAGAFVCRNGHSFDLAREGYVNLLSGRRRRPAASGDGPAQLRHRAEFLAAGHFDALAATIAVHVNRTAATFLAPPGCWLGDRSSSCSNSSRLRGTVISLGLEISKVAARQAARCWPASAFAVADLWADWPVRDAAIDLVVSIFAPKNFPEMARVLRRGGWLALAYPGPEHLIELRDRFGLLRQNESSPGRYVDMATHFVGPPTVSSAIEPRGSRSGDGPRRDPHGAERPSRRSFGPRCRRAPARRHLRHQRPFRPKAREEVMSIHIAEFHPRTASDKLWAAFNETRRAIAHEFWPDEPILDDVETRREVLTTNPMVQFRRWVAMEGDEVAGWIRAAFRRPGTPHERDYARLGPAGAGGSPRRSDTCSRCTEWKMAGRPCVRGAPA